MHSASLVRGRSRLRRSPRLERHPELDDRRQRHDQSDHEVQVMRELTAGELRHEDATLCQPGGQALLLLQDEIPHLLVETQDGEAHQQPCYIDYHEGAVTLNKPASRLNRAKDLILHDDSTHYPWRFPA